MVNADLEGKLKKIKKKSLLLTLANKNDERLRIKRKVQLKLSH